MYGTGHAPQPRTPGSRTDRCIQAALSATDIAYNPCELLAGKGGRVVVGGSRGVRPMAGLPAPHGCQEDVSGGRVVKTVRSMGLVASISPGGWAGGGGGGRGGKCVCVAAGPPGRGDRTEALPRSPGARRAEPPGALALRSRFAAHSATHHRRPGGGDPASERALVVIERLAEDVNAHLAQPIRLSRCVRRGRATTRGATRLTIW